MKSNVVGLLGLVLCAVSAIAQTNTGTIKGHVRLSGAPPGNPIIRMGIDPICSKMNAGKVTVQERVAVDVHGALANVFVRLEGNFSQTPVPSLPVTIDRRGCIYTPRVVGVRVGQTLQVRNNDPLTHDVHGLSKVGNSFNVSTPAAGPPFSFKPKGEEIMLRIGCDVHRWMIAYAGVVTNPYFAVSGKMGTFEIDKVPPGTYVIQAWQEEYGPLMKTVKVTAGDTITVDFTYTRDQRIEPAGGS
jgi:plastocyanin